MAKVLVVDDEPDIRLYHRIILQKAGHEIVEAPDGSVALDIVRSERPDIVITDYMMPVMTGGELVAALRSDSEMASVPIIMISASKRAASATQPDLLFGKPAPVDKLVSAIDEFTSSDRKAE